MKHGDGKQIVDIEITVRMVIPGAVSRDDLVGFYKSDPLQCAKELIETGGLTGATSKTFEVLSAAIREG